MAGLLIVLNWRGWVKHLRRTTKRILFLHLSVWWVYEACLGLQNNPLYSVQAINSGFQSYPKTVRESRRQIVQSGCSTCQELLIMSVLITSAGEQQTQNMRVKQNKIRWWFALMTGSKRPHLQHKPCQQQIAAVTGHDRHHYGDLRTWIPRGLSNICHEQWGHLLSRAFQG